LIALGATLTLRRGTDCRTLALEALYHDYMVNDLRDSEFVASVQIPPRNADQVLACYKISKRFDQDISALCAGFSVTLNDGTIRSARIAFGGMAGTVKRATHCEAALQGQPFSLATITAAQRALADDYTPMSDMRASDGYRRQVAANLLQRFYLETTGEAQTDVYNYAR
ncbi:MAG: FAD binding domain-containing protein, partial [Pseudomonadota bacterium]